MHGLESRTWCLMFKQKLDVQCCWKHPSLWKYCSNVFLFTSSSGKWDGMETHASWWKKRVEALFRTAHVKNCYFQVRRLLNIRTFSSRAYQQAEVFYFVKWKYQRNRFQSVETIWISSGCTFTEMEMHLTKFYGLGMPCLPSSQTTSARSHPGALPQRKVYVQL